MQSRATYTVGEMALRIARPGGVDEAAVITRQLRNWTGLGLLTPIGDRHEGTGRHRLYDYSELMKAALLEAMARNFRVDVTGLQAFTKRFNEFFLDLLISEAMTENQYPVWMGFRRGKIVEHGFGSAPDIPGALKDHEMLVVLDAAPIAKRIFA